jgi:hypothetical protein
MAARDPGQQRDTAPPWLLRGYLGPGKITLLTNQRKSGKTTLAARLLARMKEGGQLAGLPVAAGRALVTSEESQTVWDERFEQLGLRGHVDRLCRPFVGQPTLDQWLALLEAVAALHQRDGIGCVPFSGRFLVRTSLRRKRTCRAAALTRPFTFGAPCSANTAPGITCAHCPSVLAG